MEEGEDDADSYPGNWGGTCMETLVVWGPDPVKFQEGGGTCLIEKSLLHILLRLLRCIHLFLGYLGSAFLHAGIQLQPGRNRAALLLPVAWLSGWVAQQ